MAKTRQATKIFVNGIDLTRVFKDVSVLNDRGLRKHFADAQKVLLKLERAHNSLGQTFKDLEAQDKLGNFQIQDLMSRYNEASALASSLQKKLDQTIGCMINKIG